MTRFHPQGSQRLKTDVWIFPVKHLYVFAVFDQCFVLVLGTPAKHFCRAVPFTRMQAAASTHQSKAELQVNVEEKWGKSDNRYKNITLYSETVKTLERTR